MFLVEGSLGGALTRFPRNMVVLRDGGSLTVVNAVRLDAAGEAELEALGKVEHVIRIAAFHGMDDPYYLSRFDARYWAQPGRRAARGLEADEELTAGRALPVAGLSLIELSTTKFPEAVLHLDREGGVLISADAVQNFLDTRGMGIATKALLRSMGFIRPAGIGPLWRRQMQPEREDYERMLERSFEHLLTGHGPPLTGGAREALRSSVARTFG